MTFSLLKAQVLLKARQHKYTHRKLVGRDPKTNRKRYRYYYAEHHGGGITSAEIEAGSAFKLTFKGRRGHFHVQSVEGDTVTVRHDGRPNSKPVEMTKAEFRALLKRQHETVENKKREKAQENRRRGRKKRKGSKRTKRKTTPQTQAPEQTPQVQDPEQGADNFETMPEVESAPAQTTFPLLGMEDEADYSIRTAISGSTHTQATEKVARHLSDLNARAEQEIKQGADRAAVKKLFTEHARAFQELTQKLEDSTTPRKRAFVQKKIDTLLNNPPSVIRNEPAKGAISPEILDSKYTWFANRVPQAEDLGITPDERVDLITALEKFNERDRDLANEIAIEIRDNPKSASVQRAVRALLESQGETYETMPEPDPSPAREQLTETAREVVQDQEAETPPVSKEDLMDEDDDTNEFDLFPSYSQGIWRAFSAFSKDKNLTTNQKKQLLKLIDSVRLRLEDVLFTASQTHPVEMKGYVRQDNKIYLLLDDLADHLGVPLERSKRSLNISSETNQQHMHKLVFGQLKNLDIKKDTTLGEISEKLAEMVAASINTREERARVKEEARQKFRMREEMVNQAAEAGLPWSVAKDIETPKQLERALKRRDKKRKDSEKREEKRREREEKRREREAEKRKKKAEEAFDRNRRFERFPDEYPQASQARFVRGKAKSTEKQREKRQGQLDQFLQRTGTPAQQQETRGPVTSLAQMSSLSEAPPKFKTMIKRFTSTTKGDPFKRPFVKEGRIYATNGVILFEGPETSLPDGPFNVSGEPVENPPTTPPVVGFIEDLKQKQQHATTFDAETVKHIHGAISALGYKKEKYDDEGVFIEASGNSLTVSHMGVQLASVPLVEGSEIQGSYAIKGVNLKEALSAGGPVSLHLSPLNNEEDLRTPLTFRSRFGNTVIMPASR